MPESLFASLLHTFDRSSISQIASTLGESEQGVSKASEASMASVLAAMASRADDPGALRRMLELVPDNLAETSWSRLATGWSAPNSSLITTGRKIVSSLFGSGGDAVANAISRESGISARSAATLLSMAAPMVLGYLKRRVREDGLSMRALGTILQREAPAIRNALPAGLSELFWPAGTAAAMGASPVVAQSVQRERSYAGWAGALGVALLVLGSLWLWSHARRVVPNAGITTTGEANRMANEANRSASGTVRRTLPGNIGIDLPANSGEANLLGVIQGTNASRNTWLDMDHMYFDSGSATLRPDATGQLDNVAAILQAYPNVDVTVAGYTDDVGTDAQNMDLSKARAESVKDALVSRNIAVKRITTQGFGEQNPASENSTEAGRAKNRRVSMRVTQR
jgi:OOP family OmpA-OmpF porin